VSATSDAQAAIDAAMNEAERLRRLLRRGTAKQVRSAEERAIAKATAMAWFGKHRPLLAAVIDHSALDTTDECYRALLSASDREAARSTYDTELKSLKQQLSGIRTNHVVSASTRPAKPAPLEAPPSFAKLVGDAAMQAALARRWTECNVCVSAGAPLAAVVMMGGLLEALLLARVNAEPNKASIFTAKAAPKDKNTGKALPLKEWMLRAYIDVAHELGWISQSAKDLGEVLRDYRNYIHPYKELSHGVSLTADDAALLWDVSRSIAKQLVR
jgi:hypothetical protein